MGGTAPPQIPRRFGPRNDSCVQVTACHNHLEMVLALFPTNSDLCHRLENRAADTYRWCAILRLYCVLAQKDTISFISTC